MVVVLPLALADQVLVSSQVLTVVVSRLQVDLLHYLDYNQQAKEMSRDRHGMVTMSANKFHLS